MVNRMLFWETCRGFDDAFKRDERWTCTSLHQVLELV
jgi:hypothetical protein